MEKITENHPLSGSQDILADNIQKLKEIFPEVFSEGRVDFEKLQLLLGDLISPKDDLYGLNWWGKTEAIKESMKRSLGTLRPDKGSSKNWDTTENLYIEGDNLEVLKLLQKSYTNKIKMIYIDPPYNTGKDFVYKDNYNDNLKNYLAQTGQVDSEGIKQSTNTKDDGRYHSNWLNMMYPRLKLARNLLTEDGVIFISIDDNEVHNLREICDEIFGESNFRANFLWRKKTTTSNVKDAQVSSQVDYTLCYGRSKSSKIQPRIVSTENRSYPEKDNEGNFRLAVIEKKDSGSYNRETMKFPILGYSPREGKRWQLGIDKARELEAKNRFVWDGEKIKLKIYDFEDEDSYSAQPNLILDKGTSDSGSKEVNVDLFDIPEIFDNPKPTRLIQYFSEISTNPNDIILDFFSGSASTAHSTINLNSDDNGKRKFICVQIPESIKDNPAFDFLKSINKPTKLTEIGKERIRRAGEKILAEKQNELDQLKSKSSLIQTEEDKAKIQELEEIIAKLDIGFKVFKLDSSNIEAWNTEMPQTTEEIKQQLEFSRNHLRKGRTEEDLLYELLLKQGLLLTSPIEEKEIAGAKVYNVSHGELFICMNAPITMAVIEGIGTWGRSCIEEAIVDLKPVLVLKDEAFGKDDAFKTNAELRLKNEFGFAKVNTL